MTASPAPDSVRLALAFSSLGGGGIQRGMLTLAKGFLARGFEVDLLVVDPKGELEALVPARARVVDLAATRTLFALPSLTRYLRNARPAAVLSSQTHLNLVVLLARKLSGVPTRVVVSEHIALDAVLRHAATWKERLFPFGARLLYPWADGLIVASRDTAARFVGATGLPPAMATVVYNPVVTPDLVDRAAVCPEHPWPGDTSTPLIVSAGRLVRQKDHETLLRAFALVREATPARLLILGEGEERAALEAEVRRLGLSSDVQMPGFVTNPFCYMARASLFALSSRWEGFGNVLVEAMACGTPVVSTDCPSGPSEILQGGVFGRLVSVGSPRALADAMLQSLGEPHDAGMLRQRAMDFSAERSVAGHLKVLLP